MYTTEFVDIDLCDLLTRIQSLKHQGMRFVQLCAELPEDGIDLVYTFYNETCDNALNLCVRVPEGAEVPSIQDLYFAAFSYENEAHDLFGVQFINMKLDFGGHFFELAEKAPMTVITPEMKAEREKAAKEKKPEKPVPGARERFKNGVLSGVDLSKSLTDEEYKEKLKKLQKRLSELHSEIYRLRIPVVIGFEGWDAGGKGGAIKRLTSHLDPRGYRVNPTASPNDIEKVHHYLWRFWNNVPKAGHIAIFDRTWYGRVMVERIEGFCTEAEWKRAYQEINEMESHMANAGAVVLKFWLHIDKDEQERRFKERQENPAKQWKITEEDWRNRAKWDAYEEAVNEMLVRTSTTYAPWIVVEGNDKHYARVKVLKTVVDALEKKIKEVKG